MSMRFLALWFYLVAMLSAPHFVVAERSDTTVARLEAKPPVTERVVFPDMETRLIIAGAGVIVLGGLAALLNAKRNRVDTEAGIV